MPNPPTVLEILLVAALLWCLVFVLQLVVSFLRPPRG